MKKIAISKECTISCLPGSVVIVSDEQARIIEALGLGEPASTGATEAKEVKPRRARG